MDRGLTRASQAGSRGAGQQVQHRQGLTWQTEGHQDQLWQGLTWQAAEQQVQGSRAAGPTMAEIQLAGSRVRKRDVKGKSVDDGVDYDVSRLDKKK